MGDFLILPPQRPDQLIHLRPQCLVIREARGIAWDRIERRHPVAVVPRARDGGGDGAAADCAGVARRDAVDLGRDKTAPSLGEVKETVELRTYHRRDKFGLVRGEGGVEGRSFRD